MNQTDKNFLCGATTGHGQSYSWQIVAGQQFNQSDCPVQKKFSNLN